MNLKVSEKTYFFGRSRKGCGWGKKWEVLVGWVPQPLSGNYQGDECHSVVDKVRDRIPPGRTVRAIYGALENSILPSRIPDAAPLRSDEEIVYLRSDSFYNIFLYPRTVTGTVLYRTLVDCGNIDRIARERKKSYEKGWNIVDGAFVISSPLDPINQGTYTMTANGKRIFIHVMVFWNF